MNTVFSRRIKVGIGWAALVYASYYLQPLLGLDIQLSSLLIEKSTWVAGILIAGLSGTDAMMHYVSAKNGNGKTKNGIAKDLSLPSLNEAGGDASSRQR